MQESMPEKQQERTRESASTIERVCTWVQRTWTYLNIHIMYVYIDVL